MDAWAVPVVSGLVGGLVAAALVRALRARAARSVPGGGDTLAPSGCLTGLLGGVGLFFTALLVVSHTVGDNPTRTVWTSLAFGGFALLSFVSAAWSARAGVRVDATGLHYYTPLRPAALRWADVVRVRYVPAHPWFVVETAAGQTARVSGLLEGLPVFARAVLDRVPPTADIDADTRAALVALARGHGLR